MVKLLSYPLTVLYIAVYLLILCLFHPLQWIALTIFGYSAHKGVVDVMNFFLIKSTYLLGTRHSIINTVNLPLGTPIIFVSNHQSLFDISPIAFAMRRFHPKFVSKQELAKGIPSVSFNLKHGGSVAIDRSNPRQSMPALKKMAEYIEENKRAVLIFPEGTRSKTGKPRGFSESGLKILCKYAPSAYIVPVTINNSWKMMENGLFPLGVGNHLKFQFHDPISVKDTSFAQLFESTEQTITKFIN